MSKLTPTYITRIPPADEDGYPLDVYADGRFVNLHSCSCKLSLTREEALLLVEAITARLAEVTEG